MARGVLLLALLSVIWGSNWPVMKIVLGDVPILTFRALCLVVSGPAVLALARLRGEKLRIPNGSVTRRSTRAPAASVTTCGEPRWSFWK